MHFAPLLVRFASCLAGVLWGLALWADQNPMVDRVVAAYYPPLMIDDQSDAPGSAVEIVKVAAQRAGREIRIEFIPFPRALHRLQTEPNTLIPALFRNTMREPNFHWIIKHSATQARFLSISEPINTLEEAMKLDNIGTEKGATTDLFLTGAGFTNLLRLGNPDSSARMLHAGRIDAWFLTEPLARQVWDRLALGAGLVAGDVIFETPIYVASHLDFPPEAIAAYERAITDMMGDGTVARILAKYD